ncbi:MAG: hypothetical protein A2X46_17135 [Lentisphaerae bacterium GWF2_57_35]|nr:MAG: hypothetical protein A2X46_17135 [Lentisphaerae bacterium GWF2_57_35]
MQILSFVIIRPVITVLAVTLPVSMPALSVMLRVTIWIRPFVRSMEIMMALLDMILAHMNIMKQVLLVCRMEAFRHGLGAPMYSFDIILNTVRLYLQPVQLL